jgi:transposase
MRFSTKPHQFYGGIDWPARTMSLCVLNQAGAILLHRNMTTSPETLLRNIAPYRADIVVAVECRFTWSWLADRCAQQGIPLVLGHALYMKAIHGGKAKHDPSAAHKIAVLLRGGMLPQAYVYPAAMRGTRHLLRRRMPLMRKRAELLTPIQKTKSQYNLPEMGQTIAYKANRAGVAERFAAPAVQTSLEVDLALMSHYDALLRDRELSVLTTAKAHHTTTLYLLRTGPGSGEILSLGLLDELQDIHRCPRVQDVVASGRLVQCAKESAGKRDGPGGTKLGKAYLKGAFSEAAVLCLRDNPAGQKDLTRLEKNHGQGQALPVLAPHLARAVYSLRKRATACNRDKCSPG